MTLPAYAMNVSSFPEMYERWLVGSLFRPFAEALLDHVDPGGGERVLDIACGTGIVARLAKERLGDGARVVGVDVSAPMLEVARAIAPAIEWREGNAIALPVDNDERFDVVLCHQGLQFFRDKPAAAREMRRVLAPGGLVAVAAWRSLEESPLFLDLHRIAERRLGAISDDRYGFGDAKELEKLLAGAGFRSVEIEVVSRTIRSDVILLRLNTMALVGMSKAAAEMSEAERGGVVDQIVNESEDAIARYRDGDALTFELSSNMATARA